MVIDLPVLLREIEECEVGPDRLHIDHQAVLIDPDDCEREGSSQLGGRIGSTLTGTGAATARKVLRGSDVTLAGSVEALRPYLADVSAELNKRIDNGELVIVEGSQGFGLSLHHSGQFPFATSRDTTSSGFLSEVGLSPRLVTDIYLVLRTYPIRVAGNSGPLPGEISWDEIARRSRYPTVVKEFTTVTGQLRRVGEFDWELVQRAVTLNRPTAIAIHGADYLNYTAYGCSAWEGLPREVKLFVEAIEHRLATPVAFVFTGPEEGSIVDRRASDGRLACSRFSCVGAA
jgi:adenylosuccinate synthase